MDTVDDLAMPFLLLSAFRGLVNTVHADLAEAEFPGVRATHGFAMQAIGVGCTSVELGERLGITKQAASKTAQALESMGFISRVPNKTDRRERLMQPTARGKKMLELSAKAFRREIQQWRIRAGDASVDATLMTLISAPRQQPSGQEHLVDLVDSPDQ